MLPPTEKAALLEAGSSKSSGTLAYNGFRLTVWGYAGRSLPTTANAECYMGSGEPSVEIEGQCYNL